MQFQGMQIKWEGLSFGFSKTTVSLLDSQMSELLILVHDTARRPDLNLCFKVLDKDCYTHTQKETKEKI